MIIEILVWLLFTIFITWLSAVKTKHFMKERRYKNYIKAYTTLKDQPTITKSLDDKKDYLRQKTKGGNDIIYVIISAIMFILAFITLLYPRMPNFNVGIVTALVFSIIIAWVFSKSQFTGIIYEFKFIDSFIGYWFVSTLFIYTKFLDTPNSIIMIIISIIVMFIVSKPINRWTGNAT